MQLTPSFARMIFVPILLAMSAPALAEDDHDCLDVPEYQGINAVPAVTSTIVPTAYGDTVVNDAEYPPGAGAQVVVGYWEYVGDPEETGENPCGGEPTFKIVYPVDNGPKCFAWKHFVQEEQPDGTTEISLHENSANKFACDEDGSLHLEQWLHTMSCENEDLPPKPKTAYRTKCCLDTPSPSSMEKPGGGDDGDDDEGEELPGLYAQLLSGCGTAPPDVEPKQ